MVFSRLLQTPSARAGSERADTLQSLRLNDPPAAGEFIQLADPEDGFTERFARSLNSGVEGALLRQARRCLLTAHSLLLIRIAYHQGFTKDFIDTRSWPWKEYGEMSLTFLEYQLINVHRDLSPDML